MLFAKSARPVCCVPVPPALDKVGPGMCTPPPRSRAILALGLGVCCMGLVNASLGLMMLGERGVENRERMRALLKPKPQ